MAASSIASAILTIVPKMDDSAKSSIQGNLESMDMGKVGASWGKKLGASIVKGLAALGVGAFIGNALRESFDQYANYEQLVGGVETLFKDSADVVQEYAANAYQTAGLSANEYMDTVTSFSASLLQSLGNDTEAAAQYADMAITDMSDNANKMGSSMQSIQNAYQGFAKQNFTMLDNLKLGYGGTKQEMQRLLDDAEKLTGKDFDISSYSDIVEAIHAVQTEMGITGTTAKEASSTIQGSVSSAKAAWTNWLTGLADENADMEQLTDNLVQTLVNVVNNSGPIIKQLIQSFVRSLPDLIRGLIPTIKEIVVELPGIIIEILPDLLQAGAELIGALIEGVVEMVPDLVDKFIEIGTNLIQGLIDGFKARAQEFIDLCGGTVGAGAEATASAAQIASPSKVFRRLGNYMIEGLTLGWEDGEQDFIKAVQGVSGGSYAFSASSGGNSVVGAINALHSDLGKIINEYSPNSIDATRSYLGELQRKAAMIA